MGEDEILLDQIAQGAEFRLVQVVLGNADIGFADTCVLPVRQPHVRQSVVGAGDDHLSGGLAVDGVVDFVLDGGEECLRERVILIVVDAGGIDVRNLLVF